VEYIKIFAKKLGQELDPTPLLSNKNTQLTDPSHTRQDRTGHDRIQQGNTERIQVLGEQRKST